MKSDLGQKILGLNVFQLQLHAIIIYGLVHNGCAGRKEQITMDLHVAKVIFEW